MLPMIEMTCDGTKMLELDWDMVNDIENIPGAAAMAPFRSNSLWAGRTVSCMGQHWNTFRMTDVNFVEYCPARLSVSYVHSFSKQASYHCAPIYIKFALILHNFISRLICILCTLYLYLHQTSSGSGLPHPMWLTNSLLCLSLSTDITGVSHRKTSQS